MFDVNHIVASGGILAVALIIFAETGLLLGFFLPGDTLLIAAGLLAGQPGAGRQDCLGLPRQSRAGSADCQHPGCPARYRDGTADRAPGWDLPDCAARGGGLRRRDQPVGSSRRRYGSHFRGRGPGRARSCCALCTVRSIRRAWVYDRNTDRAKALVAEMAGQDPIPQGLLAPEQVHEIGEVINGQVAGRESADQVTLFKSVGNAVQDIAAATRALRIAQERGLGTIVEL